MYYLLYLESHSFNSAPKQQPPPPLVYFFKAYLKIHFQLSSGKMLTSFLVFYNFISHTSYYVPYTLCDLSHLILTLISLIYKGENAS